MFTADTLSRAPRATTANDVELEEDTECLMEVVVNNLPVTQQRLSEYASAQVSDPVCSLILRYCQQGWPDKNKIEAYLSRFGEFRESQGPPTSWQPYCGTGKSPEGHSTKDPQRSSGHSEMSTRLRAKYSVWWPGRHTRVVKE